MLQRNNYHPYATNFTRTGEVNMHNRKPYRNASLRARAREVAKKGKDGTFHTSVPVLYHSKPK